MKVEELRVGNLIYGKTDKGTKVCRVDTLQEISKNAYFVAVRSTDGIDYRTKVDDEHNNIEPIPITDELLFKNGFEQCGYIFKTLFIEMYEVANGWHLHIDNERFETALSITIKYVHQLQNAYYIATGKELEIKL